MTATLKAELRKLLTVRATYVLVVLTIALTVLFNYLGTSSIVRTEQVGGEVIETEMADGSVEIRPDPENPPVYQEFIDTNLPKEKLANNIQESASIASLFIAIAVVLMMAHEFRYNTINYSLTSSNSRTKFLASKLLVVTLFVIVASLLAVVASITTTYIAVAIKGLNLAPPDYNWLYLLSRMIGNILGYSLIGFAIATMVRNLTAGIAALFVLPTLNGIGAMLLSSREIIEPAKVLPYSALDRVGNVLSDVGGPVVRSAENLQPATVVQASIVATAYVVGLLVIAWILFLRRDAN